MYTFIKIIHMSFAMISVLGFLARGILKINESPLVDNWQPDDLLVEILLQEGFPLDSRITVLEFYQQNWVWQVESEACAHRLFVCLDERLHAATIAGAARISNGLFICLDTALSDEEKLRLADQCRLKVI